jgi:large subunit ribosomal protein L5
MALTYSHTPPGTVTTPKAPRLREWDDSSPYHKNRPKRGPRGGDVLRIREQDINWRNIPKIKEVTVHCMVKGALDDSAHLHVAGLMIQAITGVRPVVHRGKHTVAQFGIRAGHPVSLTCTLRGEEAWAFVDKCVNLVFPRIKDWPGVKGSSGDSAGNIAWGIDRETASLFPEVEINYDVSSSYVSQIVYSTNGMQMYPPRMITGFHVLCKTTATSDRHARLLLSALGVPFYGKYVD